MKMGGSIQVYHMDATDSFDLIIILVVNNMSLTIPNLVPQRPFCYLNFISVAKPQKIGNKTYDAHVN